MPSWLRMPFLTLTAALVSALALLGSDLGVCGPSLAPAAGRKGSAFPGPGYPASVTPVLQGPRPPANHSEEPYLYDLRLELEADGRIKLLSQTRYYRSEELHLRLEARPCPEGWHFRSLRLAEEGAEINFGIGEGPNRHQRYVLLTRPPTAEERMRIRQQVQTIERIRGCDLDPKPSAADSKRCSKQRKRGYFNYYLWQEAVGTFGFVMSPRGKCLSVDNRAEVDVWSKEGGRRAKPRFFETLEYALLAVSPFGDKGWRPPYGNGAVRWETDCGGLLRGLVGFAQGVYGRKMTLLEPERLDRQRVLYTACRLPGSALFRVRGRLAATEPTPVRISGFRGRIWVESFERETYVDVEQERIIKDWVEISFGVQRKKKIFSLDSRKNIVRLSLMDHCLSKCPDTEDAILTAYRGCIPSRSDM